MTGRESPTQSPGPEGAGNPLKRVVIATSNPGKLRELAALLADTGVEVLAQSGFVDADVEETGLTFVENAILKARHAAAASGLPAIGDDSGLVVDALDGAPGIRSARYAGEGAGDGANLEKLLHALAGVPAQARGARFLCVIAFMRHATDPCPVIAEGVWEGRILDAPRGDGGFGYDPVFEVAGLGCSAAELPAAEKNRISHRGLALEHLRRRVLTLS